MNQPATLAATQQAYQQQAYQEADREDSPGVAGASLLDDHEQRYLNSFFGSVASAGGGAPLAAQALGGLYTQDWMKPADVVGHVVRFGESDSALLSDAFGMFDFSPSSELGIPASATSNFQNSYQSQGSAFQQFQPQSQQLQQHQNYYDSVHTPDAVAAAATLVGRGSMPFGVFSEVPHTPTTVPQSMVGAQRDQFTLANSRYGAQVQMEMARRSSNVPPSLPFDVQYGSDPNFTDTNFVPPSAKETTEAITAEQLAHLRCLEPNDSAAPTRATSPASWGGQYSNSTGKNSVVVPVRRTVSQRPPPPDEPPARRRRTSKMGEVSVNAEPTIPTPVSPTAPPLFTQRKQSTATSSSPSSGNNPSEAVSDSNGAPSDATQRKRQRKHATARGAVRGVGGRKKAPRTTLTAEQRRQNHVGSERRRRDFIGRGYDHLMAIVPGLMNGAVPSKSVSLQIVGDWIEQLQRENQSLQNLMRLTAPPANGAAPPSAAPAAAA
ncbi:hypothetical protein VTI28DRAFT_9916 [Corynascus sepedonium]